MPGLPWKPGASGLRIGGRARGGKGWRNGGMLGRVRGGEGVGDLNGELGRGTGEAGPGPRMGGRRTGARRTGGGPFEGKGGRGRRKGGLMGGHGRTALTGEGTGKSPSGLQTCQILVNN